MKIQTQNEITDKAGPLKKRSGGKPQRRWEGGFPQRGSFFCWDERKTAEEGYRSRSFGHTGVRDLREFTLPNCRSCLWKGVSPFSSGSVRGQWDEKQEETICMVVIGLPSPHWFSSPTGHQEPKIPAPVVWWDQETDVQVSLSWLSWSAVPEAYLFFALPQVLQDGDRAALTLRYHEQHGPLPVRPGRRAWDINLWLLVPWSIWCGLEYTHTYTYACICLYIYIHKYVFLKIENERGVSSKSNLQALGIFHFCKIDDYSELFFFKKK